MSGFMGSDLAGIAATWAAAGVTVAVWSYFAGATRVFRLAQYLLAGLATGLLLVLAIRDVLIPNLFEPLIADPAGEPILWLALVLVAVLVAGRWLPDALVAVPVALLIAATAAFALGGAVVGTVLPQVAASLVGRASTPVGWFDAIVSLIVTLLVLLAFLHGTRRGRIGAGTAAAGRWVLLGGIGGWLGFLLVSRLAILVERVEFLLGDWLGLVR